MWGKTTLASVDVLPKIAPAQVTLKKIKARLSAAPGALYSGVSETSVDIRPIYRFKLLLPKTTTIGIAATHIIVSIQKTFT